MPLLRRRFLQHARLLLAKGCLTMLVYEILARHGVSFGDDVVGIDVRTPGEFRDGSGYLRFAGARHADKNDVLLGGCEMAGHLEHTFVRDDLSRIEFHGPRCLRDER